MMGKKHYATSIITVVILFGAQAFASEKEMDIGGTVHGRIELFSYDIDKAINDGAFATAVGGYLKYNTDTNRSIYGSVRFHTSQPVGYNKNREATGLFNNDKNADAMTVNSEAFIGWRDSGRLLRAGNLMLNTPMMNDDTTRIVPWSYQGIAYTGRAALNTKFQLNYIRQIRSHTSDEYKKESASGEIGDGIFMMGMEYDGFDGLDLQAYYYYVPDLYSTFTAQADYKFIIDRDHMICIGMQYFNSGNGGKFSETENKNGGDDIDLLAVKADFNAEDWMISLNYSQNFGMSGIVKGYGGLAKVFTTSMVANGRGNYKPETWMLKSRYDLPMTDWGQSEVAVTLTNTRIKDSRGENFDAYYMHWRHRFNIDTSLFVRFENMDYKNGKSDVRHLRIMASYDF